MFRVFFSFRKEEKTAACVLCFRFMCVISTNCIFISFRFRVCFSLPRVERRKKREDKTKKLKTKSTSRAPHKFFSSPRNFKRSRSSCILSFFRQRWRSPSPAPPRRPLGKHLISSTAQRESGTRERPEKERKRETKRASVFFGDRKSMAASFLPRRRSAPVWPLLLLFPFFHPPPRLRKRIRNSHISKPYKRNKM